MPAVGDPLLSMLKILEVMVESLIRCGCRVSQEEVEEARKRFKEFFEWVKEWSRRVLELCPKDATCLQNQLLQSLFQLVPSEDLVDLQGTKLWSALSRSRS